jgi:hypothetical protein
MHDLSISTDRCFGEAGNIAKTLSFGVLVHFSTKWKEDYPMNQTLSTAEEEGGRRCGGRRYRMVRSTPR